MEGLFGNLGRVTCNGHQTFVYGGCLSPLMTQLRSQPYNLEKVEVWSFISQPSKRIAKLWPIYIDSIVPERLKGTYTISPFELKDYPNKDESIWYRDINLKDRTAPLFHVTTDPSRINMTDWLLLHTLILQPQRFPRSVSEALKFYYKYKKTISYDVLLFLTTCKYGDGGHSWSMRQQFCEDHIPAIKNFSLKKVWTDAPWRNSDPITKDTTKYEIINYILEASCPEAKTLNASLYSLSQTLYAAQYHRKTTEARNLEEKIQQIQEKFKTPEQLIRMLA